MIFSQIFKRKAFSLIEVTVAIVVLAIILTPIPKLLKTISYSAEMIAIKDVLFSANAKIMQLSLYYWDEQSQSPTFGDLSKILDTNSSNFIRQDGGVTRNSETYNRLFFDNSEYNISRISATPPYRFHDSDEVNTSLYDDIDDWNKTKLDYNISRGEDMKSLDFNLSFETSYLKDDYGGFLDTNSSSVTITLDKSNLNSPERNLTSNLKLTKVKVTQLDSLNPFRFELQYISVNIGDVGYEDRYLK